MPHSRKDTVVVARYAIKTLDSLEIHGLGRRTPGFWQGHYYSLQTAQQIILDDKCFSTHCNCDRMNSLALNPGNSLLRLFDLLLFRPCYLGASQYTAFENYLLYYRRSQVWPFWTALGRVPRGCSNSSRELGATKTYVDKALSILGNYSLSLYLSFQTSLLVGTMV